MMNSAILKKVQIGNTNIAYRENNPDASNTIFFIHGNSGSSRTWRKQFEDKLLAGFRLIAFDLPGTGQSFLNDRTGWDYSPPATGKIMAEAVKELAGNNPYCLVGFSYGSNLVAEMLNYNISPAGIVLTAACVTGGMVTHDKIFKPIDNIFFYDDLQEGTVRSFFSEIFIEPTDNEIDIYTEDFFSANPPFRSALIQSVMAGKISDEIDLLHKVNIPVQVIFGSEDKLLQINYLDHLPFKTWRNKIYKVAEAGHYLQQDQPVIVNQLLSEYLKEQFKEFHV